LSFLLSPIGNEHAGKPLGDTFDVDHQFINGCGTTIPPWIPFKRGGGIFVIMDNFLIVTPLEAVFSAWKERLPRCIEFFNVALKEQKYKRHDSATNLTTEHEGYVIDQIITQATPLEAWPEFLGIRFGHGQRLVNVPEEERGELPDVSQQRWSGPRRQLAAILGKILWHQRVHLVNLCGPDSRDLLRIFRWSFPSGSSATTNSDEVAASASAASATHSTGDPWEDTIVTSEEDTSILAALWDRRAACSPARSEELRPPSRVALVAVDACWSGTRKQIGIIISDPSRALHAAACGYEHDHIALGELQAVLEGVCMAIKIDDSIDLIILGSDNLNVVYWLEKMYARNESANELLCSIWTALGRRRLFTTYIPTDENIADIPSRIFVSSAASDTFLKRCEQDASWKQRRTASFRRLTAALADAHRIWTRAGGITGCTTLTATRTARDD
jgi:hypothetical protein